MTRKVFIQLVAQFDGVTLDPESEKNGTLILDAPHGKVFKSNGCHALVEPFTNSSQSWKSDAYKDMAERLRAGLDDCSAEDCDVCEEKL